MVSMITSGVNGILNAQEKAANAAHTIAQSTAEGSPADQTEAVIDLYSAEIQATASAKVIESSYKLTGIILDIEV